MCNLFLKQLQSESIGGYNLPKNREENSHVNCSIRQKVSMKAINKLKLYYIRYNYVNLSNLNLYFAIEKRIFQSKTRTFQCIEIYFYKIYICLIYTRSLLYLQKQQTASSASGRPSSNSSVNLIQDSSAKGRMAESERGKGIGKGGGKSRGRGIEKPSSSSGKLANASSFNEDATNDT